VLYKEKKKLFMTNLGLQTSDLEKKLENVEKVGFHGWGSVGTTPTVRGGVRKGLLCKQDTCIVQVTLLVQIEHSYVK